MPYADRDQRLAYMLAYRSTPAGQASRQRWLDKRRRNRAPRPDAKPLAQALSSWSRT